MFWTVFLAALLALYIMGCIAMLGMIVKTSVEEGIKRDERGTAITAIFLSWFTIGVLLSNDDKSSNNTL